LQPLPVFFERKLLEGSANLAARQISFQILDWFS